MPRLFGAAIALLALSTGCGGDTESNPSSSGSGGTTDTAAGSPSTGGYTGRQAGRAGQHGDGASTGGVSAGGGSAAGASTGGSDTGGSATAGASTGGVPAGGSSAAGAGGCIDVCSLYGPPCCSDLAACIEPGGSCVVDVLAASVDTIYDYATLEQEIATLPQNVSVSFADTDIAWAAVDPAPAARIKLQMTAEASALYGAALEDSWTHPFRLSCNGQSLFAGVTYLSYGAAALQTPVLHVSRDAEDVVVLGLGAWQGAWMGLGSGDPAAKERIDRAELRAVFCQRGALRELSPEASLPDL